jgi:magnesium transporter
MQDFIKKTSRFIKKTSKKAGMSPGTLVHIGEKKIEKVKITLVNYDQEQLLEKELPTIEESFSYKDTEPITWINLDGLHDIEVIQKIGNHFGIHPLVLEDIVHTGQRPKSEEFDDHIFIVLKMLFFDETTNHITAEQVSLILGAHYLISFQEIESDVFNFVRERIRKAKGRIRKFGCDYLAYALIDAIVDHYFVILEKFGEKIEHLEEELLENPQPQTLANIHRIKREMIFFRKQIWPLREVLNSLMKDQSSFIRETTHVFLRDIYDHTIQVIDTTESLRDMLSGMLDLYLSTLSNRMNEVMKVLTSIATIFIPLTFVAGIYGMNFKFMPELEWKWSYPVLWVLLLSIFCIMFLWFKRKHWL